MLCLAAAIDNFSWVDITDLRQKIYNANWLNTNLCHKNGIWYYRKQWDDFSHAWLALRESYIAL